MASSGEIIGSPNNRLLGLLTHRDYALLRPHLERRPLEYRQSLYHANAAIKFVYFIETGVGSLVNTMTNGQAAEVGTMGNEGMVGLPLVLGDDRAPTSVYVQVPGAALRMKPRRAPCNGRASSAINAATSRSSTARVWSTEHASGYGISKSEFDRLLGRRTMPSSRPRL